MILKLLLVAVLLIGGTVATASDDIGTVASSPEPTAAPASASATASPTFDIPRDSDPGVILREFPPSGPRNQVRLQNKQDGRFLSRSAVSLHHSSSPNVEPMNIAIAEGQCTNCATLAIALQVVIYQRGAPNVQPKNIAIAVNNACNGCATIAWAIQYVIPVDDPNHVPQNVRRLMREMERELRYFASVKTVSELDPAEAERRLRQFIEQEAELRQYLFEMMERAPDSAQRSAAPASPSPSGAESAAPSPAPSAAQSAAQSAAPSAAQSAAPSAAESASPSPSPTTP